MKKLFLFSILVLSLSVASVQAQDEPMVMPDMDHSEMAAPSQESQQEMNPEDDHNGMEGMDHSNMPGMNHDSEQKSHAKDAKASDMQHHDMQGMEGMDHSAMPGMNHSGEMSAGTMSKSGMSGMSAMSHGSMQGGSAPADARDPNAFSDGYTLTSAPYSLPGPRQLKLADEHSFGSLMFDRFEAVRSNDNTSAAFDLMAWHGRDYDRVLLKSEGHYDNHQIEELSSELLWSHAVAAYWNSQLGVRYDSGDGHDRYWLAFGYQGLSPYWFEVDATAYLGPEGRTALNVEAEYEVLLTQRLILQPRIEADAYGKEDEARAIGAGLSEMSAGLRLRYEIRREIAPYIGVEWAGKFGESADYLRAADEPTSETRVLAGLRFWF